MEIGVVDCKKRQSKADQTKEGGACRNLSSLRLRSHRAVIGLFLSHHHESSSFSPSLSARGDLDIYCCRLINRQDNYT
jgi:hypothetical protein